MVLFWKLFLKMKLSQIYHVLKYWDDIEINISTSSKPVVIRANYLDTSIMDC